MLCSSKNKRIILFVIENSLSLPTRNLFITLMSTQMMTQQIAEYFKTQPVLKAWLFGSFARGEQTEDSDVDILVEFDKNARVSLMKHAGMIVDLEHRLSRPVDLVVEGTLLPFAVESANKDKILIYERAN